MLRCRCFAFALPLPSSLSLLLFISHRLISYTLVFLFVLHNSLVLAAAYRRTFTVSLSKSAYLLFSFYYFAAAICHIHSVMTRMFFHAHNVQYLLGTTFMACTLKRQETNLKLLWDCIKIRPFCPRNQWFRCAGHGRRSPFLIAGINLPTFCFCRHWIVMLSWDSLAPSTLIDRFFSVSYNADRSSRCRWIATQPQWVHADHFNEVNQSSNKFHMQNDDSVMDIRSTEKMRCICTIEQPEAQI